MKQNGYLGAMISNEYGGMELDMVTLGILAEELGRGCSASRNLLTVHGMVVIALLKWGTKYQKEYWLSKLAKGEVIGAFALSEPETGSDAKGIKATATSCDDYFILNGNKKWITMGQIADVFVVFAKYEDKPTAFLFERNTPGFSVEPIHGLLGARGSMTAELKMNNCRIPKANLIGKIGLGIVQVALTCLDYGRYTVACGSVGLGQACFEHTIKYVSE